MTAEGPCFILYEGIVHEVAYPCPVHRPGWVPPEKRREVEPPPTEAQVSARETDEQRAWFE